MTGAIHSGEHPEDRLGTLDFARNVDVFGAALAMASEVGVAAPLGEQGRVGATAETESGGEKESRYSGAHALGERGITFWVR